jgi:hypothetical protein
MCNLKNLSSKKCKLWKDPYVELSLVLTFKFLHNDMYTHTDNTMQFTTLNFANIIMPYELDWMTPHFEIPMDSQVLMQGLMFKLQRSSNNKQRF